MHARREYLCAAKKLADERPFDIQRAQRDPACLPAIFPAIGHGLGQEVVVGMVDIPAKEAGQGNHLTKAENLPQVPFRAGKGALGILSFVAHDREGVGLQFDLPSKHGFVEAQAVIHGRQGNRHLALVLV